MKSRFVKKNNHLMFGKIQDKITLSLISEPNKLDPMFRKTHSDNKKFNVYKKVLNL